MPESTVTAKRAFMHRDFIHFAVIRRRTVGRLIILFYKMQIRTYGCAFLLRITKYATANEQTIAKIALKPGGLWVAADVAVGAEDGLNIGNGDSADDGE